MDTTKMKVHASKARRFVGLKGLNGSNENAKDVEAKNGVSERACKKRNRGAVEQTF